jgi:hypothetical protein
VHRAWAGGRLAVVLSLLALPACGAMPQDAGPAPEQTSPSGTLAVRFTFDHMGDGPVRQVPNLGRLGGAADVLSVNRGQARLQPGPDGEALRLPRADSSGNPRRAVLVFESTDNGLDPGADDLRFGADFKLDRDSMDRGDNGNNIVQRGLVADATQYKLQAEDGAVSCRVAGDLGELTTKSRPEVEPNVWYHATCARSGDQVRLTVRRLDGSGREDRSYRQGPIGSLTCKPTVPLVIGGKLTPEGDVVRRNSDQFNGLIDNVFVHIG